MISTYEFLETLKDHNYKLVPEELEKLANSVKHDGNHDKQKLKYIAKKLISLGYANDYSLFHDVSYTLMLFTKDGELNFDINFNNGERVTITSEFYGDAHHSTEIVHNYQVLDLSFDTFSYIFELFNKYGKCVNSNNPDMVTLLENHKNVNTKSARTIL